MRIRMVMSLGVFLLLWACVDRIFFDVDKSNNYGISVDGYITDQPGPYQIRITSAFDIDSRITTKTPVSVRHLILSDNKGVAEELTEKPAYEKILRDGKLDRCGVTLLAGKAVGAPFVGSIAASLVIAEVLRLLQGGPLSQLIDLNLKSPDDRTVIRQSRDFSGLNPGYALAAQPIRQRMSDDLSESPKGEVITTD